VKSVAGHVRILHNHVQCRPQLCVTGSTSCIASSGAGYGGVGLSVTSVASHVSSGGSVTGGAGRRDCCGMRRRGPSRCMRLKSRGPGLAHPDLAPRPSARRFDGLAGSVVAWVLPLEKREHALRAVGGREGLRPMVLGGPPSQACRSDPPSHACRRCLLGVVFVTLLCHGFSVQPQWTQVPLPDRPARGLPGSISQPVQPPVPRRSEHTLGSSTTRFKASLTAWVSTTRLLA